MKRMVSLADHVIVLAHLQPQVVSAPPYVSWEETLRKLGMDEGLIAALPPSARQQPIGTAGEARVSASALSFSESGIVTEVDWPCGCGKGLHVHHDFVLQAWARHAAELTGIDVDHLEKHAVQDIDGRWRPDGYPRVVCFCGEFFQAADYLPAGALAMWETHVRA